MTTATTKTLYCCPLKMGIYALQCSCVASLGRLMDRLKPKCPGPISLAVLCGLSSWCIRKDIQQRGRIHLLPHSIWDTGLETLIPCVKSVTGAINSGTSFSTGLEQVIWGVDKGSFSVPCGDTKHLPQIPESMGINT